MAATKRSDATPSPQRGKVFIPFFKLKLVLLAMILSILAAAAIYLLRGTALERGNAALVRAFSSKRLIEPRLSGAFKAAAYTPGIGSEIEDKSDLYLASDLIQDAVLTNDPKAHMAYGRLLLAQDNNGPDAVKHLRLAVKDLGDKAEPHNDLGVCLMQRGKIEDAIDEFEIALKADSTLTQALFNHALCYERLQLTQPALADLSRLESIERDPLWRDEVRGWINKLTGSIKQPSTKAEIYAKLSRALDAGDEKAASEIVLGNYDRVQGYVHETSTRQMTAAVKNDNGEAERLLSHFEKLGGMGVRLKGDYTLAFFSKYLHGLPRGEKKKEIELIDRYTAAYKKFDLKKHNEILPEFEQLRDAFKKRKNYLYELRSMHMIARCQHHSNRLTASIKTFKECLGIADHYEWKFDYVRILSNLGLSYSRLGQDSTALKLYEALLKLYEEMNESEAKPRQLMGMAYWHLGNLDTALSNFQTSTNLFLTASPNPFELAYNYLNIADIYRLSGKHPLALMFAQEALRIADEAPDTNRAAQACSFIALEQANLNQFDASEETFKRAFEYRDKLQATEREYTEPLIYIRAGEAAALRRDTAKAVEYYTRAEELAAEIEGNIISHINALRGRAEAEEMAGQSDKAREDLQQAIDRIEAYRAGLIERDHRVEFLDATQSVYDQLIELEMGSKHFAQAYDMTEQSRGRSVLDSMMDTDGANSKSPAAKKVDYDPANGVKDAVAPDTVLGLARVQAMLPENVTLLVYSVTGQQIFTFLISHTKFEAEQADVASAKLARMVGDYVSDIQTNMPIEGLNEKGGELYNMLIQPVADRLPKNTTLYIVPDKSLHFLPFHALCDPAGVYLIKKYPVIYVPSASVLIRSIKMDSERAIIGPERFFAVGNPKFDTQKFSLKDLKDLKDAREEAEESARNYTLRNVLREFQATESEVRKGMKQCNVAHLALHCLVQEQSPWKAALVLTPGPAADSRSPLKGSPTLAQSVSPGGKAKTKGISQSFAQWGDGGDSADDPNDGLLSLEEIYKLSLPHMRLVVLSACQSGIGQYYRGEGMVSLIHPFLCAKVSTVVASLWPVNSEATADLMINFHKERQRPDTRSGDALRAAQLHMIEDGEFTHPSNWAPFIVVGGNY